MCAQGRNGEDTCRGDSGGPLVCKGDDDDCSLTLQGIVSFGDGCGKAKSPGVYVNFPYYKDWLKRILREHKQRMYCNGKKFPKLAAETLLMTHRNHFELGHKCRGKWDNLLMKFRHQRTQKEEKIARSNAHKGHHHGRGDGQKYHERIEKQKKEDQKNRLLQVIEKYRDQNKQ